MPVGVAQLLGARQHLLDGHRPARFLQRIGRSALHGDFAHDTEAAHRNAASVEDIRVLVAVRRDDRAVGGDEAESRNRRRDGAQFPARPVRTRSDRARNRLAVDVALIDEAQTAIEQHRPKIADRRAGLDARGGGRGIVIDDAGDVPQRDDGACGFDQRRERVAGAGNADGGLRVPDDRGKLLFGRGLGNGFRPGFHPTGPVRPDVIHAPLPSRPLLLKQVWHRHSSETRKAPVRPESPDDDRYNISV